MGFAKSLAVFNVAQCVCSPKGQHFESLNVHAVHCVVINVPVCASLCFNLSVKRHAEGVWLVRSQQLLADWCGGLGRGHRGRKLGEERNGARLKGKAETGEEKAAQA